jgi:hypothetical protein
MTASASSCRRRISRPACTSLLRSSKRFALKASAAFASWPSTPDQRNVEACLSGDTLEKRIRPAAAPATAAALIASPWPSQPRRRRTAPPNRAGGIGTADSPPPARAAFAGRLTSHPHNHRSRFPSTNAVWPDLDGHSNQELRYALGRATPFPGFDRASISPHRAAFDVVVTAAIFEELIKKARWSELVQWSGEPALYTRFHFGKYRGKAYDEIAAIDPDYLRWIVEKSELEEGIK